MLAGPLYKPQNVNVNLDRYKAPENFLPHCIGSLETSASRALQYLPGKKKKDDIHLLTVCRIFK